jgi:hypothetical protein
MTTDDLCREIRNCVVTGVRFDLSKTETQGAVIPTIPQSEKGVDVEIEVEDGSITEIAVYPIRTKDHGHIQINLKHFLGLFDSVAYMWSSVEKNPLVELLGYYKDKTYRVQLFLVENMKGKDHE